MDDVLRQIEQTYTSVVDPKYFSISEVLERQPYADLVAAIGEQFTVVDDTDENSDVAFIYALSYQARRWALGISAVGPYAVLGRVGQESPLWTDVVQPTTPGLDEYERWLVMALTRHGLRLLGRRELEQPVSLRVAGMSQDRVRVYQALFTQSDILPWDADTLGRLGLI